MRCAQSRWQGACTLGMATWCPLLPSLSSCGQKVGLHAGESKMGWTLGDTAPTMSKAPFRQRWPLHMFLLVVMAAHTLAGRGGRARGDAGARAAPGRSPRRAADLSRGAHRVGGTPGVPPTRGGGASARRICIGARVFITSAPVPELLMS